jgi:predicted transcriptional regulator YdeE
MLKILLATAGAVAATALTPLIADEPNPAKVHIDSFVVMGISTVTTNEREASPDGLIGKMWARLRSEDILKRIPNRNENSIIAVYCDYENVRKGSYKYVLGAAVNPTRFVPRGMVTQTIQAGTYARYTAQGTAPPVVVELWKRIWSDEKPGGLERAYKTDYEVYPQGPVENASKSRVNIYIGLK